MAASESWVPYVPGISNDIQPFSLESYQQKVILDESRFKTEAPRYLTEDELDEVLSGLQWPTKFVTPGVLAEEMKRSYPTFLSVDPPVYALDTVSEPGSEIKVIQVLIRGRYGIPGAIELIGFQALKSLRENVRIRLRSMKIHPAVIPELRSDLRTEYFISQTPYGSAVGIHAREALGGPIMQMTLNSFKLQGVIRRFSYSVSSLSEILNASQRRSQYITLIMLTDVDGHSRTLNEAIALIPKINQLTINTLLVDVSIEAWESLNDPWLDYYIQLSTSAFFQPLPRGDPGDVLVLTLNRVAMLNAGVTVKEVSDQIERVGSGAVIVIPTPLHKGLLYVVADVVAVARILSSTKELKEVFARLRGNFTGVYFRSVLVPALDDVYIRGIRGLSNFVPEALPVWGAVSDTTHLGPHRYRLMWAIDFTRRNGIGPDRVKKILEKGGIEIVEETERDIVVETPRDVRFPAARGAEGKLAESPTDVLTAKGILGNEASPDPDATYVMGGANGRNLLEIFRQKYVDYTHTISNDMHEIMSVLGIEAVYNYLVYEIWEIVHNTGSYIDPRAVIELVDFMTNRGFPTSVTYAGVSRQKIGAMTKASIQQPFDNLVKAAFLGGQEAVKNNYTTILAGRLSPFGTGVVTVTTDKGRTLKAGELPVRPAAVKVGDLRAEIRRIKKESELPDAFVAPVEPDVPVSQSDPAFPQPSKMEALVPIREAMPQYPNIETEAMNRLMRDVQSSFKGIDLPGQNIVTEGVVSEGVPIKIVDWAPPPVSIGMTTSPPALIEMQRFRGNVRPPSSVPIKIAIRQAQPRTRPQTRPQPRPRRRPQLQLQPPAITTEITQPPEVEREIEREIEVPEEPPPIPPEVAEPEAPLEVPTSEPGLGPPSRSLPEL